MNSSVAVSPSHSYSGHEDSEAGSEDDEEFVLNRSRDYESPERVAGKDLWRSSLLPPHSSSSASSFLIPSTVVKEPEVKEPESDILEAGISCQRLGQADWQGVRYSEAEKRLKRGAMFQPLQMNHAFASQNPAADFTLRRQERILGSLTYGLLSQRKALIEARDVFLSEFPQVSRKAFDRCFFEDTRFSSVTDDIFQVVIGRRSEILSDRRSLVEPKDSVSKRALRSIPPSSSHVFDEEKLNKLILDPHIRLCRPQEPRVKKRPLEYTPESYFKRLRPSFIRPELSVRVPPQTSPRGRESFRNSEKFTPTTIKANKYPNKGRGGNTRQSKRFRRS